MPTNATRSCRHRLCGPAMRGWGMRLQPARFLSTRLVLANLLWQFRDVLDVALGHHPELVLAAWTDLIFKILQRALQSAKLFPDQFQLCVVTDHVATLTIPANIC